MARTAIEASFAPEPLKATLLRELHDYKLDT